MAEQYFLVLNGGVGGEKGVCISRMEKQYFEAYREKLPGLWFHEHEGLERVRVDSPIPGKISVDNLLNN